MSSDFGDEFDDFDFSAIDDIENAYTKPVKPTFQLPPLQRGIKQVLKQKDLFGGTVQEKSIPVARAGPSGVKEVVKVVMKKKWDRGSFAIHGWSKKNAIAEKARVKGKGKARAYASDEEGWEEEVEDDEEDEETYLDLNFDPKSEALPIKWEPDPEASKTWIYPVQADKPLRTYQYNIVHAALFDNTLVSLPTGLGKTFIAACVMLNFYRWYPKGKIIFLAPTRPLVTQQIKACHYIAGIKQEDCVELTGHTSPALRAIGWATKRVIYSTPQTVENDLKKGRLDPRDVTCLVVDEAHRAGGDYAYVGVVRYLMSVNPHFRLLALTATPGSRGDAVQDVIDNLHIGRIEVRTDHSMDITQYVHKKTFDLRIVDLPPLLSEMKELLASVMRPLIKPVAAAGLIHQSDPELLSPYTVTMAYAKMKGNKSLGHLYVKLGSLGSLARAMEALLIHSLTSANSKLLDFTSTAPKEIKDSSDFQELMKRIRQCMKMPDYFGHPKMHELSIMCRDHFLASKNAVDEYGDPVETRVMVFCNFREVIEELVEVLNRNSPLIKAVSFIGQGTSKGKSGKSQKQQLETIRQFKKGEYNVLVASSIGEEGLDIGEIDLIVCYEANKSPIRMLQRVGRTGRARDGTIIVLMTKGREDKNWAKANDAYDAVQNAIVSGKVFELYCDGDRMLPKDVKPVCEKTSITALPLVIETMTMAGHDRMLKKANTLEKKEKKKRDTKKNVPVGASLGFTTASKLALLDGEPPKKKSKVDKTLTQDTRERKSGALLSADQEDYLRNRWRYTGNGKEIKLNPFDSYNLPFTNTTPVLFTTSSEPHLQLSTTMRTLKALEDEANVDVWYESMAAAFVSDSVTTWTLNRNAKKRPHQSLRIPVSISELSSPASVLSTSAARNQATSSSSRSILVPTPTQIRPIKAIPKLPKILESITVSSSPEISPPRKLIPKKRSETLIDVKPVAQATYDPSGVLSSDEDEQMFPIIETAAKASTSYLMDEHENEMNISDDEVEIVEHGLEENLPSPTFPTHNQPLSMPKFLVAEDVEVETKPEPEYIPDSEDDESHYFPTPEPKAPLAEKDESNYFPVPSNKDHIIAAEDDWEGEIDFASFEMAEEDFLLMDQKIEGLKSAQKIGRVDGLEKYGLEESASEVDGEKEESENEMKPPQSAGRVLTQRILTESNGSGRLDDTPSNSYIRRGMDESIDMDSPVIAKRKVLKKKVNRMVVVGSSSPFAEPVGKNIGGGSGFDSSVEISQPVRARPAMRRGRLDMVARESKGKERESTSESSFKASKSKSKSKTTKTKKRKLDDNQAKATGLFDIEAINSSHSSSGSSSCTDAPENSQDRRFVANDDSLLFSDGEISMGAQNQFYRDSLATQAPGAKFKFVPRERAEKPKKVYSRRILSQEEGDRSDNWSYDSFCVADDDDIVYSSDSQMA